MRSDIIYSANSMSLQHDRRIFGRKRIVAIVLSALLLVGGAAAFSAFHVMDKKKGIAVSLRGTGSEEASSGDQSESSSSSNPSSPNSSKGSTTNNKNKATNPSAKSASPQSSTGGTSPSAPKTSASSGSVTAPSSPAPTGDACGPYIKKSNGANWNCVFNDDFNGTSVDPAKWSVATSPDDFMQIFECYSNRPQNVYVSDGMLNLVSRRENPQIPCGWVGGKDFSGGMVRTLNKFHLTRGKVEIRIKFPSSQNQYGIATSLWMFHVPAPGGGSDAGYYGKWPASGEIDIAEVYGPFDDYVNPSLHYDVQGGHRLQSSCGGENYNAQTVTARCLVRGANTGFHTYGMEWTANTVTIFYDNKPVLVDKWDSKQGGTAPFDKPFYLNITQGFANLLLPGPYSAVLPATAQVDYVKMWQ